MTFGSVQLGGTDIWPILLPLVSSAAIGPSSAPSAGSPPSAASALGASAAAAAAWGMRPSVFSEPMIPLPIDWMFFIEPIVA
ncbi:hypothetical protein DSM43519_04003 [Mycobacterium marinum]|nr:hypothetical protein DSM43519_04003 [Mycobacterium marinum]